MALANKFTTLLLMFLIVALVAVALAFTGRHGWLALIAFVTGLYLILRLRQTWRGVSARS